MRATLEAIAGLLGARSSIAPTVDRIVDLAALEPKYTASKEYPSNALILKVLIQLDRNSHIATEGSSEDAIVQDMAVQLGFRNVHFSPCDGLGWAIPLGVGISLATGRHSVCFVGDGGSLFSIHAIWTAAKYRIPAIFICFVNHEYRLLKDLWCYAMGTTIETSNFVGMDFRDPDVSLEQIAAGFGARTEKIKDVSSISRILDRSLAHNGPSFLIIDREP